MTRWEYLIVSLPAFEAAKSMQGGSASVNMLNREGLEGWEAVGISSLADASVAVLLKRPHRRRFVDSGPEATGMGPKRERHATRNGARGDGPGFTVRRRPGPAGDRDE